MAMIGRFSRTGLTLLGVALYGGPVLAGLARHDWSVLPVLATLFLIHVVATRKPDLATGAGRAGLAIMAVVQMALVTVAWAGGLALAGLIGAVALPLWAPLAITAAAAGLGAWAYRDAAEMDRMLNRALDQLAEIETLDAASAVQAPWPDPLPDAERAVLRALRALRTQPGVDPEDIDPIVHQLYAEAGVAAFDPFYDAAGLEGAENEPVVDCALLRFTALRPVFDALAARGEAGLAPTLLLNAPHARVRAEARARIAAMVEAGVPGDLLPDPNWLAELAAEHPGEGYTRLSGLCGRDPVARVAAQA